MEKYDGDKDGESEQNGKREDNVGFEVVAEGEEVEPVLEYDFLERGELTQLHDLIQLIVIPADNCMCGLI